MKHGIQRLLNRDRQDLPKLPQKHAPGHFNVMANRQSEMEAGGTKGWVYTSPSMGRSTTSSLHATRSPHPCSGAHLHAIDVASPSTWPMSEGVNTYGLVDGARSTMWMLHGHLPVQLGQRKSMPHVFDASRSSVTESSICEEKNERRKRGLPVPHGSLPMAILALKME